MLRMTAGRERSQQPLIVELVPSHPGWVDALQGGPLLGGRGGQRGPVGRGSEVEAGVLDDLLGGRTGQEGLDGQAALAALKDAQRGDYPIDVPGRGDEIESLDEDPPRVLGPPEDDPAGRRHDHRRAAAARQADLWMGMVADDRDVRAAFGVDLDRTEEDGVNRTAGAQIVEVFVAD